MEIAAQEAFGVRTRPTLCSHPSLNDKSPDFSSRPCELAGTSHEPLIGRFAAIKPAIKDIPNEKDTASPKIDNPSLLG